MKQREAGVSGAEVWVTGIGLCSPLGTTLAQTWQALTAGKTSIVLQQPFPGQAAAPLALLGSTPSTMSALLDYAMQDLVCSSGFCPSWNLAWGVVVGSSRGHQAELEHGVPRASALNSMAQNSLAQVWPQIYHQTPAQFVAQQLQLRGALHSPRAACATGIWAIAQGAELIRARQCDAVIAGAVDAPITPLTVAGFRRMGALSETGAYPFDKARSGLVLGEGAALLLLERADLAKQRGAVPYGRVLGYGITNDAYHVSAPHPQRHSAIAAIRGCLQRSQLVPEAIDYIHAHGTATTLNDAMEAELIQTLFPESVRVSSTKGATGHTLGASGALGAAFCLMALQHQRLPPCVGLQNPAYPIRFVTQAQRTSIQSTLCLAFGFGGQNAAIAFAQLEAID